jgi:hypothetical protein
VEGSATFQDDGAGRVRLVCAESYGMLVTDEGR